MNRYSIGEAAKLLGVTQQAIHNRINRGKIRHERGDDGKQYVYLTEDELSEKHGEHQLPTGFVAEYIETLKAEIDDRKEEARRKDHIIMALTQRIPALEASPDERESTVTAAETQSRGEAPQSGETASERLSWWRRLF